MRDLRVNDIAVLFKVLLLVLALTKIFIGYFIGRYEPTHLEIKRTLIHQLRFQITPPACVLQNHNYTAVSSKLPMKHMPINVLRI